MNVSFGGNIHLRANTYSVKNQNGEEIKPSSGAPSEDIEINTDKVAYVSHQENSQGTAFHMLNGDVITANPPFDVSVYDIAQQLKPSQTIGYDANGKISIYDKPIDKLREALKSVGLFNSDNVSQSIVQQDVQPKQTESPKTEEVQIPTINEEITAPTQSTMPSGFKSTYNLNGIDYNVVGMHGFNNLNEFQDFILSLGMTNRGKGGNDWPMQCHNFSCEYGDIMLGTSKIDINSPTAAKQASRGKDRQFQNVFCRTNDAALQLMRGELEEGRPCVARIRRPGTRQNHYGLVCGIRKDADMNNLKNTDFLYIDSYDGKIGQLNGKNYRELSEFKNAVHIWQGKDYNFEYRNQGQCARKFMSADEVKSAYGLA